MSVFLLPTRAFKEGCVVKRVLYPLVKQAKPIRSLSVRKIAWLLLCMISYCSILSYQSCWVFSVCGGCGLHGLHPTPPVGFVHKVAHTALTQSKVNTESVGGNKSMYVHLICLSVTACVLCCLLLGLLYLQQAVVVGAGRMYACMYVYPYVLRIYICTYLQYMHETHVIRLDM